MPSREVVWEVSASTFETLHMYSAMHDNAEISQQDFVERMRQLGMPHAAPGTHVRIVLRTAPRSRIGLPSSRTH